ncbi:hypothetical protein PROVRETT_08108 [Providencia rettgeri DSM 1131]|nr:hypothetical protein PROVRETT_08108 [Providencia rettgeri DSM 1131]
MIRVVLAMSVTLSPFNLKYDEYRTASDNHYANKNQSNPC